MQMDMRVGGMLRLVVQAMQVRGMMDEMGTSREYG